MAAAPRVTRRDQRTKIDQALTARQINRPGNASWSCYPPGPCGRVPPGPWTGRASTASAGPPSAGPEPNPPCPAPLAAPTDQPAGRRIEGLCNAAKARGNEYGGDGCQYRCRASTTSSPSASQAAGNVDMRGSAFKIRREDRASQEIPAPRAASSCLGLRALARNARRLPERFCQRLLARLHCACRLQSLVKKVRGRASSIEHVKRYVRGMPGTLLQISY